MRRTAQLQSHSAHATSPILRRVADRPSTREETRAQTRAALLDAAEERFLLNGYQGTSLEEIAEAAGYSKGAVYSNFESKEDLFLEVKAAHDARQVQPLIEELLGHEDIESKLGTLERWIRVSSDQDSEWLLVETEFALIAHRTPGMAKRLREAHRGSRASIAEICRTHAEAAGLELAMDAELIAETLIAMLRGLALAHAIDPQVHHNLILPVFRRIIGADET